MKLSLPKTEHRKKNHRNKCQYDLAENERELSRYTELLKLEQLDMGQPLIQLNRDLPHNAFSVERELIFRPKTNIY